MSEIERMSVRRAPIPACAPSSRAAQIYAARVIGGLGSPADQPIIVSRLVRLLRTEPDPDVGYDLSGILATVKPQTSIPELIECIVALLGKSDRRWRFDGAWIAAGSGRAVCTQKIVSSLRLLLDSEDWSLRSVAAEALSTMMPSPLISNSIIERLTELLWDQPAEVFVNAVKALGQLPPASMTVEMIVRTAELCGRDTLNGEDADAALGTLQKFRSECRIVRSASTKRRPSHWRVREISDLARINIPLLNNVLLD